MKRIFKLSLHLGTLLFFGPIVGLVGTVYLMVYSISRHTKETATPAIMAEYISISLLSIKYGLVAAIIGMPLLFFGHILSVVNVMCAGKTGHIKGVQKSTGITSRELALENCMNLRKAITPCSYRLSSLIIFNRPC